MVLSSEFMQKKRRNFDYKKVLSKFCVWLHQMQKTRSTMLFLIFADRVPSNMNLQPSVWRAQALLLYVVFPFWWHSFLWIYFARGWQNRGEKIKQWWLRIRCNFSSGARVCVCQMHRNHFYQCGARELRHNRKTRHYLHRRLNIYSLHIFVVCNRWNENSPPVHWTPPFAPSICSNGKTHRDVLFFLCSLRPSSMNMLILIVMQ